MSATLFLEALLGTGELRESKILEGTRIFTRKRGNVKVVYYKRAL